MKLKHPRHIVERDLAKAAIHEAAHKVVGRHLGIETLGIELEYLPGVDDPLSTKTVAGRIAHRPVSSVQPLDRAAFGLAGVVAEAILDDADLDAYDLADQLQADWNTMSATDLKATGDLTDEKVIHTLNMVRAHWDSIRQEADWASACFWAELEEVE